jgi:hypothetical protein
VNLFHYLPIKIYNSITMIGFYKIKRFIFKICLIIYKNLIGQSMMVDGKLCLPNNFS